MSDETKVIFEWTDRGDQYRAIYGPTFRSAPEREVVVEEVRTYGNGRQEWRDVASEDGGMSAYQLVATCLAALVAEKERRIERLRDAGKLACDVLKRYAESDGLDDCDEAADRLIVALEDRS